MADEQCNPMCSTLAQGICDKSRPTPVCIADGPGPFRDMEGGFDRIFSYTRT